MGRSEGIMYSNLREGMQGEMENGEYGQAGLTG